MQKEVKSLFLNEWERSTENLAQYFSARYFGNGADMYWIANDIGGVLHINDYFFNLEDIVDYIKYDYNSERMFSHYQYKMDCIEAKKLPINIKNYIKLK